MSLLLNVLKLDVFELNYLKSSSDANIISNFKNDVTHYPGLFYRVISFFKHLFKNIAEIKNTNIAGKSICFFVSSQNQLNAIEPVYNGRKESAILLGIKSWGNYKLPIGRAYLWSIFFFPLVLYKFIISSGYKKISIKYFFDSYLLTYGFYIVSYKNLKSIRPELVITTSDHTMHNRAFDLAAKHLGIKRIFMQHASATDKFPPLKYDFAFLDGKDSLIKYINNGTKNVNIFLTGFPKLDYSLQILNNRNSIFSIGVCLGKNDEIDDIEVFINELNSSCSNLTIKLRPHPADTRMSKLQMIANKHGLFFSNSTIESSIDFLKDVDLVISGDSNILLEAAIINVVPIKYNITKYPFSDLYGFIKNGLVEEIKSKDTLFKKLSSNIKEKEDVRVRAKFYNETINTIYDGKSTQLVNELITNILSNEINEKIWEKYFENENTIFKLKV